MHQLLRLFQPHKHFFFRGGKAAQDPALHGDGALKFEGQAEIEDLAWHGAGQDNSSREQLGIIRGIPRVVLINSGSVQYFSLATAANMASCVGWSINPSSTKLRGKSRQAPCTCSGRGRPKHPADDGFFFLRQAFQQLRFGYRYQLVYAKMLHRAASSLSTVRQQGLSPVAVGAVGLARCSSSRCWSGSSVPPKVSSHRV